MPDLLVASNNQGKIREIKHALQDLFPRIFSLKEAGILIDPEETGQTYLDNALIKARAAAEYWEGWILSDDSGLEVDALDGKPGVFSARFGGGKIKSDQEKNAYLLDLLRDIPEEKRTARFRCVAVLLRGTNGETVTTEGTCEGIIAHAPKGKNGFGYDPVFFIPPLGKTMAELTFEEKMRISHRADALMKLKEKIKELENLD